MNLRHLRIFKTVCEEVNVTRAATKLYMTQPAVSHVLRDLETELGYPLFDRISRRLYITQAGELFLEKVRQVLAVYDELEEDIASYEKKAAIKIGSCITIANFWLPELLHRFHETETTPTKVEVDSSANIIQKLKRNEIDLAFLEGVLPQGDYIAVPFSSYQLIAVCSPSYPIAHDKVQKLSDLAKENFLLREKGSALRDTFDSCLKLHQLEIEPIWTSTNSQALLQAARNSLGIAVLATPLVQEDIANGNLIKVSLPIHLENKNYIVYHREKYISSSMQHLLAETKTFFHK